MMRVKLNDGYEMPVLGLGTWKSQPGEVREAVAAALRIGYRHLDCAHVYQNEKEVGEAIAAEIAAGTLSREDLFVTSKLWNTFHRPDLVEPACRRTLADLGLDRLDLYLIHWPFAYEEGGELFPSEDGKIRFSDVDYLDTWREMEALVRKGLVRSVGLSNFNARQTRRLWEAAEIKPVTNQIECHPYLNQRKLSDLCRELGVTVTAYSPLGSPDRPWAKPTDLELLDDPRLKAIADGYGKTTAQILIRYQIDRGHAVVPKSVNPLRIAENFDVFDFALSPEDVAAVDAFDRNGRLLLMTGANGHKYHPFENDEF